MWATALEKWPKGPRGWLPGAGLGDNVSMPTFGSMLMGLQAPQQPQQSSDMSLLMALPCCHLPLALAEQASPLAGRG